MPRQWSGKTEGTPWMQRNLIRILRHVDHRVMYGVMSIVIIFYMILSQKRFRPIFRYFREVHGFSVCKSLIYSYKNFYAFGQTIVDRFAAYAGKKFNFIYDNFDIEKIRSLQSDGMIIISSHIGNYEIGGYHISSPNKPVNILAYYGETETVMRNRKRLFAENNMRIIAADGSMDHVFRIHNALENGEIVSMHGDRRLGSNRAIVCNIFGKSAPLPFGPYHLASIYKKPLLFMFVMKENWNTYKVYGHMVQYAPNVNRETQAEYLAKQFASQMEQMAKQYPCQWFHFYNFWMK